MAHDHLCVKIVLVGDHGVGKTSLFDAYCPGTVAGLDFAVKIVERHGLKLKLQVWDMLAGGERFRALWEAQKQQYFRGAAAAIVVFDLTNASFMYGSGVASIPQHVGEARRSNPELPIVLVGNKSDLPRSDNVKSPHHGCV